MNLVLYYSPGACSLAAHIALREAKLAFELRRTPVASGDNLKPDYLAVNPRGRIPTLLVDGRPVRELSAILSWIGDLSPGLVPPPGSYEAAVCREWLAYFTSSVHITFAQIWRGERFLKNKAFHKLLRWEGLDILRRQFDEVEAQLSRGPYLTGHAYTLADANALVFYRWGRRMGFDMDKDYPNWTAHTKSLLERPAVKEAVAVEEIDIWAPPDAWTKEPMFSDEALAGFDAAWARKDPATLLRHMHAEGKYSASVGPEPGETFDTPKLKAGFEKMLRYDSARTRRSGRVWHLGDIAFVEWSFEEAPADGGRTIRGMDVFEFQDGLIKLKDAYRKTER